MECELSFDMRELGSRARKHSTRRFDFIRLMFSLQFRVAPLALPWPSIAYRVS